MAKTKILIEVKGGIVQNIIANTENVEVTVVDYDSEDWDDSKDAGQTIQGSAWMRTEAMPDVVVDKIYKAFEKAETSEEKYVHDKLKELNF